MISTYQAVLDENAEIRVARQNDLASRGLEAETHAHAIAELEAELEARVPEQLRERVEVLPQLLHVWACFWELDSTRPVNSVPTGLGAAVPLRGAIPWHRIEQWLESRGIEDETERTFVRLMLKAMEGEFAAHQSEMVNKETADEDETEADG